MRKLVITQFNKLYKQQGSKYFLLILGILFFLPTYFIMLSKGKNDFDEVYASIRKRLSASGEIDDIKAEVSSQMKAKEEFFSKGISREILEKQTKELLEIRIDKKIKSLMRISHPTLYKESFATNVVNLFNEKMGLVTFCILGFPAFVMMTLMSNPFVKYIVERLILILFVIFGVTFLVFTILYMSPMDPAINILGELATEDQVLQFKEAYGLDKSYWAQLLNVFKGLFTFDLGKSYVGNEDVYISLMRRFPITLQLTFASLALAVTIAIPSGIISAIKPYSSIDYVVMLLALIGLSIPGFWLGLILILNLSIETGWLPATFVAGDWKSFVMPSIVLGTGLAASVARMTRSSMLEVINQDYIVTAKAKGLSSKKVIFKHALGNAMIPIVTVVGIQFGSMLGGAAVTEKVFNVNGIGSYIVDKQFIPDVPVVLAGVVYVAVVVSLVNLFVDVLYAFLDPRIKAKMKSS